MKDYFKNKYDSKKYESEFVTIVTGDLLSPQSPYCQFDQGKTFCDMISSRNDIDIIVLGNHEFRFDEYGRADIISSIIEKIQKNNIIISADNIIIKGDSSVLKRTSN